MTPEQYAQAVREALADHPERGELLEDLDDHLAEIAAESELPLEDRLGPPEVYAEELAAAYGDRPESGGKRRFDPRAWALGAHTRLMGQGPYRSFVGFLPELRPGWWVLRGYLLAMLLLALTGEGGLVPPNLAGWALVAAGVWISVWLGRARRGRLATGLMGALNLVAALTLFAGMVEAASYGGPEPTHVVMAKPTPVWVDPASSNDGVYNIKPYGKDGTPLSDVYLYDQDGKPLTTNFEDFGYTVDRSCGEPILNRYPLPLVEPTMVDTEGAVKPSVCPTPTPSPKPAK
ncbi:DUF1700 domain-containing protein [Nonomuraea angiospora]|uniref:hypothetical protein n=1 Tax=Nonomuraea angiospora TaxID=46172 RepID=UPI0029AAFC69|nr:hypothetical protein [Nonomuraea angiospora]MDX3107801.1 hypothetical protein [Nonomuraea angiospora]